ncbi:MAG: S46 family peptidase [Bacteroidota bacterium]
MLRSVSVFVLIFFISFAPAKEGMWIPTLLKALEGDMQAMGLKLSAEDIYSVNKSSLKDAIVKFGSGCTGEIISRNGLLLTNHHCGYGSIQKLSSLENDYLKYGFWAMNASEELLNPGLSVTFIVRIEDMTEKVLGGLSADMDEGMRSIEIQNRIERLSAEAVEGTHYEAEIKPFYYGNEYYMIVTEKYLDIRLVGAPPSSIGKFGGDTDNWVWPRHTGDFSMWRVYTGPDGKPAEYSEDNIPMKPKHFFPISLKGADKDDFTMVFGFPARTQEYLTSYAVDNIMNIQDPVRIKLRTQRLEVIDREMLKSDKVRIQYASKQSRISNGWKKWKGEIRGLKRDAAIAKKQAYEAEFMKRVNANPEWKEAYGGLLDEFKALYEKQAPLLYAVEYFREAGYTIELVGFANQVGGIVSRMNPSLSEQEKSEEIDKLRRQGAGFFKDYYAPIDQEIMGKLLRSYYNDLGEKQRPQVLAKIHEEYKGDFDAYAAYVFENSNLSSQEKFDQLLENLDVNKVLSDPAYMLMSDIINSFIVLRPAYLAVNDEISALNRTYMKALREVYTDKTFYPDANFTLRLTYGKAEGMAPSDGVQYKHYTTLEGVMAKYIPGDSEFDLPAKLIELYEKKDYGQYAHADGSMRVCFIASNHTSGGNSGSPLLDANGHLLGLNFDRNWEGTMSDINYDINQCRNISVDARYVLFIMDKMAGAGYLLDEMELVK